MIVHTHLGQVEGVEEHGVQVWKGVRYALPPIGQLRFKSPKEPNAWEGIREAKQFAPAAIQSESPSMKFLGDSPENQSEDCLFLNIWSPNADDKKRPVMVWIHGGSQMYGSGSSHLYDGSSFAGRGDVVVVTLNYRLGVFGFLHLTDVGGEEYLGSGNCGHLDQIAALEWV